MWKGSWIEEDKSVTLDPTELIQFKVALVEKYLMLDNLTKSKKSLPKPFLLRSPNLIKLHDSKLLAVLLTYIEFAVSETKLAQVNS